jgi:hypothetical protein
MISPWEMRGKGIGFADRPVVPAVRCPREPWEACGPGWVRQEERRHVSALELQALAYARGSDAPAGSLLGGRGCPSRSRRPVGGSTPCPNAGSVKPIATTVPSPNRFMVSSKQVQSRAAKARSIKDNFQGSMPAAGTPAQFGTKLGIR